MRDIELEMKIQKSLNEGNNVWVVGDVHGFNQTLRSLVAKLDIKTGDYVVLLGDLIDRGPDSYDVIQFVKNSPNMATVKGNHEKMMAKVFSVSVDKAVYDVEIEDSTFKCECERWPENKGWDCDDQRNSK